MAESDWLEAVRLAKRLAGSIDVDATEREYKVQLADRLMALRPEIEAGVGDWVTALYRAMGTNLVHYLSLMRFREALMTNPEEGRRQIMALWTAHDKGRQIAEFFAFLKTHQGDIYPGAALAIASNLLLAAGDFAPYKSEPTNKFARAIGLEPAATGDIAARWDQFAAIVDELGRRLRAAGVNVRDRIDAQSHLWILIQWPKQQIPDARLATELEAWRSGAVTTVWRITRGNYEAPECENGGWDVLRAGLLRAPNLYDSGDSVWRPEVAADLASRMSDESHLPDGSFWERMQAQLDGADPAVYLLAADLLYLEISPLANVRTDTKRARVMDVLEWSGRPRQLPQVMLDGTSGRPSFNGGQGYSAQRWRHMLWLAEFVTHWSGMHEQARAAALEDPWTFERVLRDVRPDSAAMRYLLAYYAWPNVFVDIVSPDHRRRIRDAFASEIGGATGDGDAEIAWDLFQIRSVFEEREGRVISFYQSPYVEQWRIDPTRRAWFVSAHPGGAATVTAWREADAMWVEARELAGLAGGLTADAVASAVAQHDPDASREARDGRTRELVSVAIRVKAGDMIVTLSGDKLLLGEVSGRATPHALAEGRLEVGVAWLPGAFALDSLPGALTSALATSQRVAEITDVIAELDALAAVGSEDSPRFPGPELEVPLTSTGPVALAAVTAALADELYMPAHALERISGILGRRRQIVLYGPPGTGKTYIARKLARFHAGADHPEAVVLVQFHPSYSYEDFFEGFRPDPEGASAFRLTRGPLARLADEARKAENRGRPYFLIIDEMNRGNLAKVFGELYFLLEYRDQSVSLQYTPEKMFTLPENLFIIGTMNTSDRSIGLVDAAIRRRFPFVELHPDASPVEGVLRNYLRVHGYDGERARLLQALNARIPDRDLRVGPSYLMRNDAATEEGLNEIWEYELIPLLREHFFGRKTHDDVVREFSLEVVRRAAVSLLSSSGVPEISGDPSI